MGLGAHAVVAFNFDPEDNDHIFSCSSILVDVKCYVKATTAGWRFSEGGTHEETLRPQDQEGELRGNKRSRMTRNWGVDEWPTVTRD